MNMEKFKQIKNKLINSAIMRKITLVAIDIFIMIIASAFVLIVIPQGSWGNTRVMDTLYFTVVMIVSVIVIRLILRIYNSIWRYSETTDYLKVVTSDYIACCVSIIIVKILLDHKTPIYFIALVYMLELLLTLCSRFFYKYIRSDSVKKPDADSVYIAIVGAGNAGIALVNEIQKDKSGKYIPYCFFDTDPSKTGMRIQGVKVRGTDTDIPRVIAGSPVKEIIVAIPSMSLERRKVIFDLCSKTGCKVKIFEYALDRMEKSNDPNLSNQLRDINTEDFLSRKSVNLGFEDARKLIEGKVVLVTGGGGSIGSELCRQVAAMRPKALVILDIYENNAYDIQQELKYEYGSGLDLKVEIASVREEEKIDFIFEKYRPDIVFHAAAHKHVPLMEECCDEAIKNNVFGTYNVVQASEKYGVQRMLLISTDKAVNPTNLMGASKRICEMIIQSKKGSKTIYAAVRFGNVLGSNGSVIPLFKKQIEHGGPVTITDKRIIRYFMTIPEAVQLVITAATMMSQSEIFVLDMGDPVKILDLAERMIRLAGLKPYQDIAIIETGLRPGEKLYEELLMKTEKLSKTTNDKIFIEEEKEISFEELKKAFERLKFAVATKDNDFIRSTVMGIVPTYKRPEDVNNAFEGKEEVDFEAAEAELMASKEKEE